MASITRMPTPSVRKDKTRCLLFEKYESNKRRFFIYNANALADFEQETGMGFGMMLKNRATFAAARGMVFAGLKQNDRAMTIDRAGELISSYISDVEMQPGEHDINAVLTACIEAAVEQGALGVMKKIEEIEDDDEDDKPEQAKALTEAEDADPNVIDAGPKPTN